ncbi:probable fucosyltransferase 8 isoform X2 [Typha angustifolia]|uniref:probable fucosyltransferase 8 isoform X2 n=1 Tax=Typha angustifolia TaxID=59011 RepID=UPI003C2D3567
MDLKRSRSYQPSVDIEMEGFPLVETKKKDRHLRAGRIQVALLFAFLLTLPLLCILYRGSLSPSQAWLQEFRLRLIKGSEDGSSVTLAASKDRLLGGLLSPDFDTQSCLSRYDVSSYRKASPSSPSSYLLARLRRYESLHKRCGPNTLLYNQSIEQLKTNHSVANMECNYVVWTPFNGLGNRMLTIVSAFLYALLTNRVLLIHVTDDLVDLFCEPFPGTSWVLPSDFILMKDFSNLHLGSPQSYGSMLKNKVISNHVNATTGSLPASVYLHLEHDYQHFDRLFFCENDQLVLEKVNWLVLQSDIYFVPSLFLMPQHKDELEQLFPAKDTVFHHLGRYLFHPTNSIWGMVTRYYNSYLAEAEERIGLQIRIFSRTPISFDGFFDQIVSCFLKENLLPNITLQEQLPSSANMVRSKAVLVTSLYSKYSEKMKSMYYEHPTTTGEVISIYQPTHEEEQHTEQQSHNQKALAEIYLLSLCDVLVTSAWSTFGYVGQSLAGLKPWILLSPQHEKAPSPPCLRAMSMEPCFHTPPNFDCRANKYVDMGDLVRHVRHCEDVYGGVKLVD